MAKLTQHTVKAIIKQYLDGATISYILESRGLPRGAVTRILRNAEVPIRVGRRPGSRNVKEFRGKTVGKARRAVGNLPKIREARTEAGIGGEEINELLGRYPAWVCLVENGTLRATPERLTAIMDAITALDVRNSPTVRAAAEERARRFRDPDSHSKKYAKRGTGPRAILKRKKIAAAKQVEAEVTAIMGLEVRPETKAKILLALFGKETAEQLAA